MAPMSPLQGLAVVPVGMLLLHVALALGWAAGEAPDASAFRCYLPEKVSNIDTTGCNTSTRPRTAAQCFLRCVQGFVMVDIAPTLRRRGWAICPEEHGVFHLPECAAKPDMVAVQGGPVQWQVPQTPVIDLPWDSSHKVLSPDGQLMLTAGTPVRVWDVAAMPLVREMAPLKNSSADFVLFSPDGKWVFTFEQKSSMVHSIIIGKWALDELDHPMWEAYVPDWDDCVGPALSPNGERMYVACAPSAPIRLYDLSSSNVTLLEVADIPDMRSDTVPTDLVMGAAGAWVAVVDATDTLYVWSPSQALHPGAKQLYQWTAGVHDPVLAATHDGRHLLIGAEQRIFMHDVWTGARVASFRPMDTDTSVTDFYVAGMTVSPDDGWLWACGGAEGKPSWVALWNLPLGVDAPAVKFDINSSNISGVALTPDGRWGLVMLFESVLAYELRLRPASTPTTFELPRIVPGDASYSGIAPSQTEDEYACLYQDSLEEVHKVHGFNLRTRLGTDVQSMTDLQCEPGVDIEGFPSGWRKCHLDELPAKSVRLINVITGRLRRITVGFFISAMTMTPDGERLFALGGPPGARTLTMHALLGDATSPCRTWTLPDADVADVRDMQVGPSGSLVVVMAWELNTDSAQIMAWDLHTDNAQLICNYRMWPSFTFDIPPFIIAPDESELFIASNLNKFTVTAWSLRSCLLEPSAVYTIHWEVEDSFRFTISPDGAWLMAIGEYEKKVYLWDRHSADNCTVVEWPVSVMPVAASASPDGAWAILLHQRGMDLWPILPTLAYDRALKEVPGIDFEDGSALALQTPDTPIRVPSWLDATSLRTLDLSNATVTDFDWQVPSTLTRMNLSGVRAQGGGLKLRAAWLQTMGTTIDLRGVTDVDVGDLAKNPRFQRDLSSCALDFRAHGICLRRQHDEGVRQFADGRVCSSAFAVWEAGGDGGALIKRATIYADAASLNRWLCDCPEGTYGDGDVCTPCPRDSFCLAPQPDAAQAANEAAHPCRSGSGTNGAGGVATNASCLCRPGWYSVGLGGVAPCQPCQEGSFAGGWGADACGTCGFARLPTGPGDACDLHWAYLAALGSLATISVCAAVACPMGCGRGVPIAEVALEDGHVVVTTACNHRFLHYTPAAFDVHMHGTGSPGLDRQPFKVRVLSSKRLLLLDQQGGVITTPLDASQGTLHVKAPQALLALGILRTPIGAVFFLLLVLWASCVAALVRLEPAGPNLAAVASVLALAVSIGLAKFWHWQRRVVARSPLSQQIRTFRDRLQTQNPDPRACARGPERAVTMAQLDDLYRTFQGFIRDTRSMYYLWENVLKPITEPEQLSYAELVGPSLVEWFCSHFWGTPFAHFAESVRKHAASLGDREGRDARQISYWICSFSNNQWSIGDELPGSWQDSSFYLALRSGHCRGTAMILDEEATPLTRSWCLFEVLQTLRLSREDARFQGLLLCTSTGVLNYGEARLDVAMAIAERLVTLDLREARASVDSDKAMIDDLVVRDFGGFEVVNSFVRGRIGEALNTMRERMDLDLSRLALALAGAPPAPGPPLSPQRQPTLPSLLVPGPSPWDGRFDARGPAGQATKEASPQGPSACDDEFPDV